MNISVENFDTMSQECAKKMFEKGALLIIVGMPGGIKLGVDLTTYEVSEMFRGIKMIPPGPHFVYTATSDIVLRVGFLHYFRPNEVLIREWDTGREELRSYTKKDSHEQISRVKDNIRELDK